MNRKESRLCDWSACLRFNCSMFWATCENKEKSQKQPGTENVQNNLDSLASGWFWRFSQKNRSFRLPYQRPSASADCARELFNGSNGSASLVDCTRKKFFACGVRVFCEWRHKWSSFRVIMVMLPGLGPNHLAEVFRWSFHWKLDSSPSLLSFWSTF